MDTVAVEAICPGCHTMLAPDAQRCPRCGLMLTAVNRSQATPAAGAAPRSQRAIDNPWAILILLFLSLGPIAIPVLWRSAAFSKRNKMLLTVATLLYGAAMLWLCWYVVERSIEPLRQLWNG